MTVKLDQDVIDLLRKGAEVALMLDINVMVLDEHSIRGTHAESGTIFVCPVDKSKMNFDFGAIGITRVQDLSKRLSLISAKSKEFVAECTTKSRGDLEYAHVITFKHGKSKVEFKCGDPSLIKAPKGLNDEPHFSFNLKTGDISFMKMAASAMGSTILQFSNTKGSTDLDISIPTKDKGEFATNVVEDSIIHLKEGVDSFSFKYDAKILLKAITSVEKILKKESLDELEVVITRRGVLMIIISGMSAYIFPSP